MATLAGCGDSLVLPANHDKIVANGLHRRVLEVGEKAVEIWMTRSPGTAKREPEGFVLFFVGKEDRVETPLKQLILGRYGWWNLWLLAYGRCDGPGCFIIPTFSSRPPARLRCGRWRHRA